MFLKQIQGVHLCQLDGKESSRDFRVGTNIVSLGFGFSGGVLDSESWIKSKGCTDDPQPNEKVHAEERLNNTTDEMAHPRHRASIAPLLSV